MGRGGTESGEEKGEKEGKEERGSGIVPTLETGISIED